MRPSRSPVHCDVVYCGTNAKLSPDTGSRLLVAAAAPEPLRIAIDDSALPSALVSADGVLTLRYWPRPLTAACQRSSRRAGTLDVPLLVFGSGQFFVPWRIAL